MNILLHVGMPKCGSSALQAYLSSEEFTRATQGRCAYLVLQGDGQLLSGKIITAKSAVSVHGYCTSHLGTVLSDYNPKQQGEVKATLRELAQQYDTLVFSCEGWGAHPQHFKDDCIFSDAAFDVTVLAYIRPQVELMNSAWWQWGAWTKLPMGQWVNRHRPQAQWHSLLQQWAAMPWVKKVDVRLLAGDVVQDFMSYLGYQIAGQKRTNQSLPGIVLRLFQRNRQLRPGPHDSAIEFVLARHLQFEAGKTPWVIRPQMVQNLLDYYLPDNILLLDMLPDGMRQKMGDDPRWWSPAPYEERKLSPVQVKNLDREELERLAVSALESIWDLDNDLRKLRSSD